MSKHSLRVADVAVEFTGLRALDGVSLELEPGEILGLIGPNGSGKTTLVNVLTGQVKPVSGRVFCGESDITARSARDIALMGVSRSFQIVRLFKTLTVRENVEMAAVAQGLSRRDAQERADALLTEFGLAARADDFAGTLSYGDERRVEIARALAAQPQFLLLDEPAAGMNEEESEKLLAILAGLPTTRGLGLLIIDHDMPLIMRLCHRLHVLASGRTIAEGDVDTVRRAPQVVEAYLGSSGVAAAHHA